jgi:hypothetical protein
MMNVLLASFPTAYTRSVMDHVLLMAYGDSIIAQSLAIIYIYIYFLRILLTGAFGIMIKEYKIFIFYEK